MAEQLVAQTMFALERLGDRPGAPIADDFLDTLSRACAALLAADTNLNTPAKQRQGAETVAIHIVRHLRRYREEQSETGVSAFQRMVSSQEIPEEMRRSWSNS
ncbi:hypothetical protein JMG10_34265 [Nostoc ellipsosporum NOK]|nr:hypothetical protein [Nostoc ellipsosporum NOK]